jgi:hypothetical protein
MSEPTDPELMTLIRDAFLNGRDKEAIEILSTLNRKYEPRYHASFVAMNSNGVVSPNTTCVIAARPQVRRFRPMRFCIASSIAPDFTVGDLRVGNNSSFPMAMDVDGDFFSTRFDLLEGEDILKATVSADGLFYEIKVDKPVISRMGLAVDMPWCRLSQDLVCFVTNQCQSPRRFRGLFIGYFDDNHSDSAF